MMTTDWSLSGRSGRVASFGPTADCKFERATRIGRAMLHPKACGGARRHADYNICASPGRNDAMKKLAFILVAAIAAFFSAAAYAADYPSRPITIVNVFGPGSGSDTVSRIIADKLGSALGQTIIVEDRPGADGA